MPEKSDKIGEIRTYTPKPSKKPAPKVAAPIKPPPQKPDK
jgi:hypothetical protein